MFRNHINTNKYHARFWLLLNISIVSHNKPTLMLNIFHTIPCRLRRPIICLETFLGFLSIFPQRSCVNIVQLAPYRIPSC